VTAATDAPAWSLLRGTVMGRNKKYSQDSCLARVVAGGEGALLVVADGHGAKEHHRSDLGSRWAVEEFAACAGALAEDVTRGGGGEARWPAVLAAARNLPQQVVHRWLARVALHEANSPAGGATPEVLAAGPDPIPYGSTLVGAVVVGQLLLCWKLGDGDIVLVEESGAAVVPLYDGPEYGDEADSLCQKEAWRDMRVFWQRLPAGGSVAVLISTDGLSKSFADHSGFVQFAEGLRDRARDEGLATVQARLEGWLSHAASYSGDDSTLLGAFPSSRYPPDSRPAAPRGPGEDGGAADGAAAAEAARGAETAEQADRREHEQDQPDTEGTRS
jgi:Protein phosphatase 2C